MGRRTYVIGVAKGVDEEVLEGLRSAFCRRSAAKWACTWR